MGVATQTLAIEDGDLDDAPPSPVDEPVMPPMDYYIDRVEGESDLESVEEPMQEPSPEKPPTSTPAPAGGVPGILQDQQQHYEARKEILARMELLRRGFLLSSRDSPTKLWGSLVLKF